MVHQPKHSTATVIRNQRGRPGKMGVIVGPLLLLLIFKFLPAIHYRLSTIGLK